MVTKIMLTFIYYIELKYLFLKVCGYAVLRSAASGNTCKPSVNHV